MARAFANPATPKRPRNNFAGEMSIFCLCDILDASDESPPDPGWLRRARG